MLLGNWTGGLKSGLPMIGPPKIFNLVQSSTSRTVYCQQTSKFRTAYSTQHHSTCTSTPILLLSLRSTPCNDAASRLSTLHGECCTDLLDRIMICMYTKGHRMLSSVLVTACHTLPVQKNFQTSHLQVVTRGLPTTVTISRRPKPLGACHPATQ